MVHNRQSHIYERLTKQTVSTPMKRHYNDSHLTKHTVTHTASVNGLDLIIVALVSSVTFNSLAKITTLSNTIYRIKI